MTFLQRTYEIGQKAHEKMVNITSHWENADQNYSEKGHVDMDNSMVIAGGGGIRGLGGNGKNTIKIKFKK